METLWIVDTSKHLYRATCKKMYSLPGPRTLELRIKEMLCFFYVTWLDTKHYRTLTGMNLEHRTSDAHTKKIDFKSSHCLSHSKIPPNNYFDTKIANWNPPYWQKDVHKSLRPFGVLLNLCISIRYWQLATMMQNIRNLKLLLNSFMKSTLKNVLTLILISYHRTLPWSLYEAMLATRRAGILRILYWAHN